MYVQFRDAAGNWSTAATDTIVLDTTAPTISGADGDERTGSPSRSPGRPTRPRPRSVEYGLTTSYGSTTPLDPTLVTAHSVTLIGLTSSATYNYPRPL